MRNLPKSQLRSIRSTVQVVKEKLRDNLREEYETLFGRLTGLTGNLIIKC